MSEPVPTRTPSAARSLCWAAITFFLPVYPLAVSASPDTDPDTEAIASTADRQLSAPDQRLCDRQGNGVSSCPMPAFTTTVVRKRPLPPGSFSTIDADEMALRGARNVPEAIALEPSVEINQGPKAGATMQVRGFDERAMLLTFEGIPIREVYDGHFDISSLPIFSLGAIDIERGVTSVLRGPNTAGAILSLRAPSTCSETIDVSGMGRPAGRDRRLYAAKLKACRKIRDFFIAASAGYEHSDGYLLAHDYAQNANNAQYHEQGGVRDGSDYNRATLALLAKYEPRRNKSLSLFLDGIRSPRGIPTFEGSGVTRYWRFQNYNTLLAGVSGIYGPEPDRLPATWGFRQLQGQVYLHFHVDEIRDYQDASYEKLTTNPLARFVASAYANQTFGAALQGAWSLNAGNRLEVSLRYNLDRHAQREIPVPRDGAATDWTKWEHFSAHTFTVAAEDTQVWEHWRINAGAGFSGMSVLAQEINDIDYPVNHRLIQAAEGRVVLERALGEHWRLMAASGHKVRFPMLKELFSNSLGGNPELKAERAWMTEAGFDTNGFLVEHLDASLRVFGNRIQDLIESYRQGYGNVGRAVTAGLEMEIRYQPTEVFRLFSGYRYLYARDLVHDHPLDYRTVHRVIGGVRVFTRFGLTAAMEVDYHSGQEAFYVSGLSGDWVHDRLAGYVLTNIHARYTWNTAVIRDVYLFADGFNLLDANYVAGSFEPRPGREIIVGLGGRY